MGYFSQKGIDKEEYIRLIEEHREAMYRIAYGYLGNEALALEAIDEAVYLGYAGRKSVRQPEYAKTWLTKILMNECCRMLKKRSSLTFYETPPNIEDETSETISLPTKIAIQSLSEELRQVIILRYFADMTIKETAAFLDVPEGTVSTRARKALTVLRIELMDEEGGNLNEEKS